MVEYRPVKSSGITHIGHDAATGQLHVTFKGGDRKVYRGVTAKQHQALLAAPSIGSHFNKHIRPLGEW